MQGQIGKRPILDRMGSWKSAPSLFFVMCMNTFWCSTSNRRNRRKNGSISDEFGVHQSIWSPAESAKRVHHPARFC
jgi:hypothetical protein